MSFDPTNPLVGAAVTGLTSPTYTLTSDTPPNAHSEQYAVTALGGTQTGVTSHSVSSPFTLTMERPAQFKQLGVPNPATGVISNVPNNKYVVRVRKGAIPQAGQPSRNAMLEIILTIPAGCDVYSPQQLRAMISAGCGLAWDQASGIADTTITGTL